GRIAGPLAGVIGALVLMAIGLSVIWKSLKELGYVKAASFSGAPAARRQEQSILASDTFGSLLLLGGSVSLDALSVGFGLGALQVDLWLTVITMGVIAGLMTLTGLLCGRILNRTFGRWAEMIGGVILVAVGLKLLFV
ncbi:MAG: manganese efflux pump, partial [Clostridia bacterium]|nr:manganese efflux pump [Clostridia bacterium]